MLILNCILKKMNVEQLWYMIMEQQNRLKTALTAVIVFFCAAGVLFAEYSPTITYTAHSIAVMKGGSFNDRIFVSDSDLFKSDRQEKLKIEVLSPSGIDVSPDSIVGPLTGYTDTLIQVVLQCDKCNWQHDVNYGVVITVRVYDKEANYVDLPINVTMYEPVLWKCKMTVENFKATNSRELVFGQAQEATTGWGDDCNPEGKLDSQFVEQELLPMQPKISFDARWTIPGTDGTLWNIQPTLHRTYIFKGSSVDLATESNKDTMVFRWYRYDIPDTTDASKNPNAYKWYICDGETGGQQFKFNMRTLASMVSSKGIAQMASSNNIAELTVFGAAWSFIIKNEQNSLDVPESGTVRRFTLAPNPASSTLNLLSDIPPDRVQIFNSIGMIVYSSAGVESGSSIDVSALPPGLYYVSGVFAGSAVVMPFVKE